MRGCGVWRMKACVAVVSGGYKRGCGVRRIKACVAVVLANESMRSCGV